MSSTCNPQSVVPESIMPGYAFLGDPPLSVTSRNFDGRPELTEMDALIAYLQVLGTMVDFSTFTPDESR
jgi:cbb3-type cytochrome oxidase cytochrome c subunit